MNQPAQTSRLRAVVDTAVDGVILINAQGVILMFNPACERLFGYASFEVVGRNVKVLMPESDRAGHDGYLENYRITGERKIIGVGREVMARKRNGALFPVDLSVGEAREDDEAIFVGIIRDLTERMAAQQALLEGAARLEALVNTAVDGVIQIDVRGMIQTFNPACERLFGYDADDVIGQNVRILMPEPYRQEHDGYLAKYRTTGERKIIGVAREVLGRRRDGSTFPMELSVGEAKQADKSLFVGIIHDLTNRKRTEAQLAQAQKMEMVGQLSGGIAHDFNNLLTVILGNAEALSLRLKAREDLRQLAETVVQAAERGAELTKHLLAFSRRQVLRPSVIDCNHLVDNVQRLLQRTLRGNVQLRLALAPHPTLALADSAQLESAMLNLALNAQDAMPDGGVMTLTTADVELDAGAFPGADVRPGSYVSVCVSDDGMGMTRDVSDRAFEPFFTTKEVGKGSGLGLSMVYGFVKQSNGHVEIYSEPGLGTSVRLYLPQADLKTDAPARRVLRPAEIPRGDETILIVEDDDYVRSHAVTSLAGLGYRVMVAADGREALAILRAGARPELLFTDIVMPGGLNGWDLVAQARQLIPELKVLYTSGYPQETLGGRLEHAAQLLNKPYRVLDLAGRVRESLDAPH